MRPEKQIYLKEIQDKIDGSTALMLMSYQQIDANATAEFRKEIVKAGGNLAVVPKRVFLIAAKNCGIQFSQEMLKGHIGVVFAKDDPVASAKILHSFKKDNQEKIQILGGRFEGSTITPTDVEEIATLPGIQEIRAQIVGILEAPLSGFLLTVNALLGSVVYCLENKSSKS